MKTCIVIDPDVPILPVIPLDEAGSVVGWIGNGGNFEAQVAALAPGLAVLDLRRNGNRCGEYVVRVRRCVPAAKILVLGPPDDLDTAVTALRTGVAGYITRPEKLGRALRSLGSGNMFITQTGWAALRRHQLGPQQAE